MTPFGLRSQNLLKRIKKRHNLAINALFAHAPCDKLCILRAEIEN